MDGVIVINKPIGKTSHDMVYFVRRLTGIKKVGHTGTLDPEASGVLPVCIGRATKAADMLTFSDKCYRAEFILGMTTDTQDAEGEILSECEVNTDCGKVKDAIQSFVGEIEQVPPMYSAVKIQGKKLYELARKGIEIERKKRKVTIYKIDIVDIDEKDWRIVIDVHCSKGTYIRTLCEDIGIKLGCGAYMNTLQRTKSSIFNIDESYTLEELNSMKENGTLDTALVPLERLFEHLDKITLSEIQSKRVQDGVRVSAKGIIDGREYRVYDDKGVFLCVSEAKDGRVVLKKAFWC